MTTHARGAAGLDTGTCINAFIFKSPLPVILPLRKKKSDWIATPYFMNFLDHSKSSNKYRRLGMFSDHLSFFWIAPFHCLGGAVAGNRVLSQSAISSQTNHVSFSL